MHHTKQHFFIIFVLILTYQNGVFAAASGSREQIDMFQHAERGIACMQEGRLAEGIKYFAQVYAGSDPEALNEVGVWYAKSRQRVFAIDFFNKALGIEGYPFDHAVALNNLGAIRIELQQFGEAKKALKRAYRFFYELGKTDEGAKEIAFSILQNIGLTHISLCKIDKGIDCLIRSVEDCNHAERVYAVACTLLQSGKINQAKRLLLHMPEADASQVLISDATNMLGVIYYREGNFMRAEDYFNRSAKLGNPLGSANLQLLQNRLQQRRTLPKKTKECFLL